MTKRWSSTRSDLTQTKRQASKTARRVPLDLEDIDGDLAEIEGIAMSQQMHKKAKHGSK